MWQLDSDATNASSGSTAAGSEPGTGTTWGDDDPATTAPPSKRQRCAREYLRSKNGASPRVHSIVAV